MGKFWLEGFLQGSRSRPFLIWATYFFLLFCSLMEKPFPISNTNNVSTPDTLHTYLPMQMEQCTETSAYKIRTSGNYPEERVQHSEQGDSLKSRKRFLAYYLHICTNKCAYIYIYIYNKILHYITNAPTYFGTSASSSGSFEIAFGKVTLF